MKKILREQPIVLLFIAFCGIFHFISTSPYFVSVLMEVFFFAAMGNAWNIIGGFGKQILGISCIFAVGAYTSIIYLLVMVKYRLGLVYL